MTLPQNAYHELAKAKFNNPDHCNNSRSMPSIAFKIKGEYYVVTPRDYISGASTSLSIMASINNCDILVQLASEVIILGYPFFKAHITKFNFRKR